MMLKALADESRLAIIQRLNEREHTVGDLAAQVDLSEPTVSHHLARLREAEFVALRMAGNQRFYRLNMAGIAAFKSLVATLEQVPPAPEQPADDSWIDALGWDQADADVLREFTAGPRLTRLPVKQLKKLNILLRWMATLFEPDRLYSEREVNEVLKQVYETDYVSLRRDMVDFAYLRRERGGGKYWLAAEEKVNET